MELLAILLVVGVVYWAIGRQREREMERRIRQAGDDPEALRAILEDETRSAQERAEEWRRHHGRHFGL